jgi:hypothetical protein
LHQRRASVKLPAGPHAPDTFLEMPMPLTEPPAEPAVHDDLTVTAAVARLSAEFAPAVQPAVISRVVARSRVDLSGAPGPALPELVERLARQRLLQSAGAEARV